jgi:APA family basic amino acid/polyamine antiporter
VNGRWTKVRAGQAGRVIVEEAKAMRARAIVLALPPRTGTTTFGKTVETVLAERPARVIIEAGPTDGATRPTLSGRARAA